MSTPLVRRSPTHTGVVIRTASLTPRLRRVTVRAESLVGVEIRPAQDVELLLREASGRRVKRRYTIRHSRPDPGELDLDVVLHGDGPGARWGATARPGDPAQFMGPRGKLTLARADWHLLAGDESALPAFAAICEALPPTEPALVVVEVQSQSDELPLAAGQVQWLHRGPRPPGTPELLVPAVRELSLPAGIGHGYLMGETRSMVALRAVLEARGLAHEAIFVKGYWNVGRPDRRDGRAPG